MPWYEACAFGFAGGALPDLLRLIARRYQPAPDYLFRHFFWISLATLCALGGITCVLLTPSRVIDALAIGFSAPAILSRLLGESLPLEIAKPLENKHVEAAQGSAIRNNAAPTKSEGYVRHDYRADRPIGQNRRTIEPELKSLLESLRVWWGG